ncbi:MAG: 5-methyltetrahydropteroyltriglutamate--homocysteine S-methyltransferase [Planctomycetia bacterium]|nr:5-methyltetrahydropteroyltriglutamate--homocysteine S-methyltransferase [Planctomycetia bacterium]
MQSSVIGYPRIGAHRELKFASEKYFRGEISASELRATASELRKLHWTTQRDKGVDYIPSGDFSFYDSTLDVAALLNVIPARYRELKVQDPIDVYFAMARGTQGVQGDVKALAMKKWFNTNYHYIVPELEDTTEIRVVDDSFFDGYRQAKELGIETKPTIIGPFTFLQQCRVVGTRAKESYEAELIAAYKAIVARAAELGVQWLQLEEPSLVRDLTEADRKRLVAFYDALASVKGATKLLIQTYFGDVRDCYEDLVALKVDGIGLDFVEGRQTLELVRNHKFPQDKVLFAGVVNGKNIWRNNYAKTLELLTELRTLAANLVVGTSCSLLHSPYSLQYETKLEETAKARLAFAQEKLGELHELSVLIEDANYQQNAAYIANGVANALQTHNDPAVQARVAAIKDADYTRLPAFEERMAIQRDAFKLPLLPTTTIGSFPQTAQVKSTRSAFRKGQISKEEYETFVKEQIAGCVRLQEELGLDVLVHGEFERNDMVEYFGENLAGFLFTVNGWVQSYGTRCVKPPIVFGDVSRPNAMTVKWSVYTQSLTSKPVKGMLTGPVTILNWSFPREDVSLKEQALQLALAIQDEVLDLEKNGIRVVQIDEAALREKLPLRRSDWESEYLVWAIPAFRLTHSKTKPETQIHTHMCYSEFTDIIPWIDAMDADVITFEASRSQLQILDSLKENNFKTQVGPGVYDIHSPRVPSVEEIEATLQKELEKVEQKKLWVNPDCGLKTRDVPETVASLSNLVEAAKRTRAKLQ